MDRFAEIGYSQFQRSNPDLKPNRIPKLPGMDTHLLDRPPSESVQMIHVDDEDVSQNFDSIGWKADLELKVDGKVRFLRLVILSWEKVEPRDGDFRFEWIDRLLRKFHRKGMSVWLSNGIGSPPTWLVKERPEILPIDREGNRVVRGHVYCPNNPTYMAAANRLSEAMIKRFLDHPGVSLCHVGNSELPEPEICYCEICRQKRLVWTSRRNSPCGALD
jgi:beta-galactosidase